MGLWAAVRAVQAGLTVTLIEAGRIGDGASGGLLGALFPHMPDRWNEKKEFQYQALVSLPDAIAPLEAETGLSAGYRRTGRIIPLPKAHLRPIAERHSEEAIINWHRGATRFDWMVTESPAVADYIAPAVAAAGCVTDTLAARANPRDYLALLKAWLTLQPGVTLLENTALKSLDPVRGLADCASQAPIAFSHAVIAAGTASFAMIETLMPPREKPLGTGVKGQAALLAADLPDHCPVVYLDGLYIVPHEGGQVAVGSTSENRYEHPTTTDHQLDDLLTRARALVPALEHAPVLERWAGLRPKAFTRDPMLGPIPGHKNILTLTGGFKISFGIAHLLAEKLVASVCGEAVDDVPEGFWLG